MVRISLRIALHITVVSSLFVAFAAGQSAPESVVAAPSAASSSPAATSSPSIEVLQPSVPSIEVLPPAPSETAAAETSQPAAEQTPVDPASLLPDLPSLPKANASLIGGTIGKLDRVRDQIMVQVFGGGKMTIAYDTRTHIYHDGVEASASDLHQGDRVYVETILDGSTVFARNIRTKTSTVAGESQGIITSYRYEKGEMEIRDALSPRPVKVRVTSQTRIIEGNHVSSASKLAPGTLVGIKFGPRQDGSEVAREISVLAVPGASFTFVGQVTAIDLRLGLLAITSSTDHKTYEIYLDPSVVGVDENLRPSADVTVLTRFQDNRYVARSVTVNAHSD